MANPENLIRFDEMPPEQHREMSARGGIASGIKRREKAAMREALREAWERALIADGWLDDIVAYRRYLKRREARKNRE